MEYMGKWSCSNMSFYDENEYNVWCSENIPAAADYDESIHGRLFDNVSD